MKKLFAALLLLIVLATLISARRLPALPVRPQPTSDSTATTIPAIANLAALRKSFAFTGYWLNNPPGASANSWHGKRRTIQRAGFGFLLLFNGRAYAELKSAPNPGASDGAAAARAAKAEGFRSGQRDLSRSGRGWAHARRAEAIRLRLGRCCQAGWIPSRSLLLGHRGCRAGWKPSSARRATCMIPPPGASLSSGLPTMPVRHRPAAAFPSRPCRRRPVERPSPRSGSSHSRRCAGILPPPAPRATIPTTTAIRRVRKHRADSSTLDLNAARVRRSLARPPLAPSAWHVLS